MVRSMTLRVDDMIFSALEKRVGNPTAYFKNLAYKIAMKETALYEEILKIAIGIDKEGYLKSNNGSVMHLKAGAQLLKKGKIEEIISVLKLTKEQADFLKSMLPSTGVAGRFAQRSGKKSAANSVEPSLPNSPSRSSTTQKNANGGRT